MGTSLEFKRPYHFHFYSQIFKYSNAFTKCSNSRCKTCVQASPIQISDNSNKQFCKNNSVIYCIECGICGLKYIGQTKSNINIRVNGHRSDIKKFGNSFKRDQELKHFQKHSFEKANIYIVDFIQSEEERLLFENMYICKFKTIYPYGLNSIINVKNYSSIQCVYSMFNVFNLKTIKTRGSRGKGRSKQNNDKAKDFCDFMNSINFKEVTIINIKNIKDKIFSMKNGVLRSFMKNQFCNFEFKNNQIKEIFIDLTKYKLKIDNINDIISKNNSVNKEYFVCKYENKLFDNINFNEILAKCNPLFPLNKICNLNMAFSYGKSFKNIFCNYNYYSKSINSIDDSECYCEQSKYSKFRQGLWSYNYRGRFNFGRQ